jgi:hypothetical protein
MAASQSLSNLQQELLKLYASDIDDADLLHIKRYLARYFADKAIKEADKIWDEKGYTNETMNQWLNEDKAAYGKNEEQ